MSVFIIAEAGVNHNGQIKNAYKLVDIALKSGADAVKFQTFKTESLVTKSAAKAEYQKNVTDSLESQFDMIKRLELSVDAHKELIQYCKEKGIIFLSTPFDIESVNLLNELKLKIFKIPSGEITNLPLLRHIGSLGKKIILSTGMSLLSEVGDALKVLVDAGTKKENIIVLHANTMYPTPFEDVNLNAMLTIKEEFDIAVGYSDHTLGIEVDIAAVAMGAKVIEKHFTLDNSMDGPDHRTSLEPKELKEMVTAIRNIESALGSCEKKFSKSEESNMVASRKSIVASQKIKKGEFLSSSNITTKRPGNGKSPMLWDDVIGSVADKDYQADDMI